MSTENSGMGRSEKRNYWQSEIADIWTWAHHGRLALLACSSVIFGHFGHSLNDIRFERNITVRDEHLIKIQRRNLASAIDGIHYLLELSQCNVLKKVLQAFHAIHRALPYFDVHIRLEVLRYCVLIGFRLIHFKRVWWPAYFESETKHFVILLPICGLSETSYISVW